VSVAVPIVIFHINENGVRCNDSAARLYFIGDTRGDEECDDGAANSDAPGAACRGR
jgi:hypothetical protein